MTTTVEVLYWQDIPLQVRARAGRSRSGRPLSDRFQTAVDEAAMAAGLTGTDAYLDLLHWSTLQPRAGSPAEVVEAVAAELEAAFDTIPWRETADRLRRDRLERRD
jgi:hypothetical protein